MLTANATGHVHWTVGMMLQKIVGIHFNEHLLHCYVDLHVQWQQTGIESDM